MENNDHKLGAEESVDIIQGMIRERDRVAETTEMLSRGNQAG